VSKNVSRAKRKELRSKGQLPPLVRVAEEPTLTEKRAVEASVRARIIPAADEVAVESETPRAAAPKKPRSDLTLMLVLGLIAVAGIVFWVVSTRTSTTETKIDAVPKLDVATAGDALKAPMTPPPAITVKPAMPAPGITAAAVVPAPAITAAPVIPAAPVVTAAPAITAAPDKPHDRPAEKPAPRPEKPKAPAKPASASPDPYG